MKQTMQELNIAIYHILTVEMRAQTVRSVAGLNDKTVRLRSGSVFQPCIFTRMCQRLHNCYVTHKGGWVRGVARTVSLR